MRYLFHFVLTVSLRILAKYNVQDTLRNHFVDYSRMLQKSFIILSSPNIWLYSKCISFLLSLDHNSLEGLIHQNKIGNQLYEESWEPVIFGGRMIEKKEHQFASKETGLNTWSDIFQWRSYLNFIFLPCRMEIVMTILKKPFWGLKKISCQNLRFSMSVIF